MNKSEIRIGNWIKWADEKEPNEVPWSEGHWAGIHAGNYSFDKVEPIPLTEEWLKRFGFHKDLGYNIHLGEKLYLRIELPIKGSSRQSVDAILAWDYTGRWFTGHIKYVHHLQNLYHSLTGSELEAKHKEG